MVNQPYGQAAFGGEFGYGMGQEHNVYLVLPLSVHYIPRTSTTMIMAQIGVQFDIPIRSVQVCICIQRITIGYSRGDHGLRDHSYRSHHARVWDQVCPQRASQPRHRAAGAPHAIGPPAWLCVGNVSRHGERRCQSLGVRDAQFREFRRPIRSAGSDWRRRTKRGSFTRRG